MKKNIVALLTLLAILLVTSYFGCSQQTNFDVQQKFHDAQKAFDTAKTPDDYLKVAGMYQNLLDHGTMSGAVLYNQGNAYMKAGQRGRAIAAYRQAEQFLPTDPYLEANLSYALGDNAQKPHRRPIIEYLMFWQRWISYGDKFRITGSLSVFTFVLAIVALFFQRRLFTRLAICTAILTALFALSAGYDWYQYDYIEHGVVVKEQTVARKGNSESYEPAFTEPISEGVEFDVVARRGDWVLIRLPGNQEGWVKQDSVVTY